MASTSKEINAVLYILNKLGKIDFHKLFKIMYFADQKHLVNYGSVIYDDPYMAMDYGPVPSYIYDNLKLIGKGLADDLNECFDVTGRNVNSKIEADMDFLSESEIECIDESIEENRYLSFGKLKEKSHGFAYEQAGKNDKISEIDMAKEIDPEEDLIKYIKLTLENKNLTLS